ncbi:MAG: pyruvate carboxylase [Vicinamibacterales bacterium]|jgi:pyruvate carboxylase|nr:pyruvate carboxylase [Acidobacteriota bacterium]MDP7472800.1 pyruvate carboxylase [Vicinamibacterales bacterium]MDP7672588.1 pyruvate carboxylase [Vicinamibacterales bacterium]HJO38801.1 pyruvate carboxylase [Vicinamibacterales bacterium]
MQSICRLLVANRSEIAIRIFRAGHELGIGTVAVYAHEDRYALHRFKADEAYEIGAPGEPIRSYLDVEAMVSLAVEQSIDAIHPGYGFLSESPALARACAKAGIIFVGPSAGLLEQLGDKVAARALAKRAGVPVLPGSERPVADAAEAKRVAKGLGYPVLLKAAKGGGGRGMRVVERAADVAARFEEAQRESMAAFGSPDLFLERYIARPRHIEVQLLGDQHGHLVHLYERDCSVQRRHQKVVEIAPSLLPRARREEICAHALALGRAAGFDNAGTVEFLLDSDTGGCFFIEVNPRIQVEHTVTEAVTGVDIVKAQILAAQGIALDDDRIGLPSQQAVSVRGHAIQCRVTTEVPENSFIPDYGKITHYRSPGGMGVRLDAGTAFSGAVVTPHYDSLLVKVVTSGQRFPDTARRMERCLQEFRVRGVKTNLPFLINLVLHPTFLEGACTTRFIDETPELLEFSAPRDRATKLCTYLAEVAINGHPLVPERPADVRREPVLLPPHHGQQPFPDGTRDRLRRMGAERFCGWIRNQRSLLVTDTTFRDAHQSLLATRIRTYDMLAVADLYARRASTLFSLEMWGGATFDSAMRFLKESPWARLTTLRKRIPNILFQMLLRGANGVGYGTYPDNVVRAFVAESASAGIDVFRIFDALNYLPNMKAAMDAVRRTDALCEAAICYTGDIIDPDRTKYSLDYYVGLARELEKMGAHLLCIKDMAGLCKPYAAELLVKALRQETDLPIHFHTHDSAGVQAAAILKATEAGLDIADAASGPLSGMTSQPTLDGVVEALRFTKRDTGLDGEALQQIAEYWEAARDFYQPFEAGMRAASADVYRHEMPGGQTTNLRQQAASLGLASRWHEICRAYEDANRLLGDVIKVTPSSKAIGDLALYLVTNNLSADAILTSERDLAFPDSVVELVSGGLGQPHGGFPPKVRQRILRGQKPKRGRPGAGLPAADLKAVRATLSDELGRPASQRDVLSHLMFPKVFAEFSAHEDRYSDVSVLPTPSFLYGLEPGEETVVEIERGKTLLIRLVAIGEPNDDGVRTIFFELNGQPRHVTVQDRQLTASAPAHVQADPADPKQLAAAMPGLVTLVAVKPGDRVSRGEKLLSLEAMKMETSIYAERDGEVAEVLVHPGTQVVAGDLVIRLA